MEKPLAPVVLGDERGGGEIEFPWQQFACDSLKKEHVGGCVSFVC